MKGVCRAIAESKSLTNIFLTNVKLGEAVKPLLDGLQKRYIAVNGIGVFFAV